jgi:UDP-N-acetylglucosamine 2-epimerase (non-hydrolysing)
MPEEINRVLTDQISDFLFTTEREAQDNLAREGIPAERVHFVGNVMIDSLRAHLPRATPAETTLARARNLGVFKKGFALLTLHRPSNVDDPDTLRRLLETLSEISKQVPIVFPVHPRTEARIAAVGLKGLLATDRFLCLPPLPYLDTLGLMAKAKMVLTDSGGIQEETTALGVPCITLRENTERPITVMQGTNTVVGIDRTRILSAVSDITATGGKAGRIPEFWDGKAALRIAAVLSEWLSNRSTD